MPYPFSRANTVPEALRASPGAQLRTGEAGSALPDGDGAVAGDSGFSSRRRHLFHASWVARWRPATDIKIPP